MQNQHMLNIFIYYLDDFTNIIIFNLINNINQFRVFGSYSNILFCMQINTYFKFMYFLFLVNTNNKYLNFIQKYKFKLNLFFIIK